jgi:gamma-glutamylputrescine oxidase
MNATASPRPHVASWYAATAPGDEPSAPVQGDINADVVILGAGLTGLSAALALAEAGRRVVVLEAERIGWGASGRNGGQVIAGYGCEQHALEAALGADTARTLFDWSVEGIDLIHQRCAHYGIDAEWMAGHATVPIKPRQERELREGQRQLAERYGYATEWWNREQLRAVLDSDRYLGALFDPRSGHLHPLKYVLGLARAARERGVQIFEASPVTRVDRGSALSFHTRHGSVRAPFGVLAGNALLRGIAPELESRVMPVGSYIAVSEELGAERIRQLFGNGMAVADTNWALDYFRPTSDHRLLFGGRASYSTLPPPNLPGVMRRRIARVFPRLGAVKLDYVWGGMIDISLSRAPHWGRLGDNLYYAQGFSGHGLNTTQLAGQLIAEAIQGQSERIDVFSRLRHLPFPGGRWLRTPLLVAAMAWYKLRDALW